MSQLHIQAVLRNGTTPADLLAQYGPSAYGPTRGFSSLPQASSLPEATVQHCRCGDLTLARPGVPCGRCGELP